MPKMPTRGAAPLCSLFLCALAGCGQCDDVAERHGRSGRAGLSTLAPIMMTRDLPCGDGAVAFEPPLRAVPRPRRPAAVAAAK